MRALPFISLLHRAEDAADTLPPLMAAAEKAAHSILAGEHTQRKVGTGEKFWQFREYDPSDRPQDIDWRQSARGDRVFVRQKEWQTTQTALFWCQHDDAMTYSSDDMLPTKYESALVLSLALSILFSHSGELVGPADGSARPARTPQAVEKLGRHIFEISTPALPAAPSLKLTKNSSLILAGDFLAPLDDIESMMKDLSARTNNIMMIQVLDPAELTLPFDGRVVFEETGNGKRHNVEYVSAVRAEYIERIKNHIDGVKALCRKQSWHWVLHTTDEEPRATLHDVWQMIGESA